MVMERRRTHAGGGGQTLDGDRFGKGLAQDGNGPCDAPCVTIGPTELPDGGSMPPGEQPIVHLAPQLRLQHRQRLRPVQQPHQTKRGVSDLPVCRIDAHGCGIGNERGLHFRGERGNQREVQFEHQRIVGRGETRPRDLADGRYVCRHQQRIPRGKGEGLRSHRHLLAALHQKADEWTVDIVEKPARPGRAHGEQAGD